jgi:hypothetical protein
MRQILDHNIAPDGKFYHRFGPISIERPPISAGDFAQIEEHKRLRKEQEAAILLANRTARENSRRQRKATVESAWNNVVGWKDAAIARVRYVRQQSGRRVGQLQTLEFDGDVWANERRVSVVGLAKQVVLACVMPVVRIPGEMREHNRIREEVYAVLDPIRRTRERDLEHPMIRDPLWAYHIHTSGMDPERRSVYDGHFEQFLHLTSSFFDDSFYSEATLQVSRWRDIAKKQDSNPRNGMFAVWSGIQPDGTLSVDDLDRVPELAAAL